MIFDDEIRGRFVYLKSITVEDADFSYHIRADKKNRETVGQLAESVEAQRRFIEKQIETSGDYYFVVYNRNAERIGLIGVYDIRGDIGEFGREVNIASAVEAMEAEVLLSDFAVNVLGLKRYCSVIYTNNRKHIKNQEKLGIYPLRTEIRNGVECFYYEGEIKTNDKRRELLSRIPDDFLG